MRLNGLAFIGCSLLNVRQELRFKVIEGHVLGLFNLHQLAFLRSLHLDLINNVESASVVTLKVSSTKLPDKTILLSRSKEALTNVTDEILLLYLRKVVLNLLLEGHAVLASSHKLLNLGQVVLLAIILVLFENLNASSAVACANMFNEHGTIANQLALQSVHKRAVPAIEAI